MTEAAVETTTIDFALTPTPMAVTIDSLIALMDGFNDSGDIDEEDI